MYWRGIQVGRPKLLFFYLSTFSILHVFKSIYILAHSSYWGFIIINFSIQDKNLLNKEIVTYSNCQVDESVDCEYSVPVFNNVCVVDHVPTLRLKAALYGYVHNRQIW